MIADLDGRALLKRWQGATTCLASVMVLVAASLMLAGGRWAAYIVGPWPGVGLADALLVASCIVGLVARPNRVLASYRRMWLCLVGVVLVVTEGVLRLPTGGNFYLFVRDSSPFLYLATIPVLVVILGTVDRRVFMWCVRAATGIGAVVWLVSSNGLLVPVSSSMLSDPSVLMWSVRSDFAAVVTGVGFIVWGGWPSIGSNRAVQFLLAGVIATSYSRAGLVVGLLLVALGIAREARSMRGRRLVFLVAGTVGSIALFTLLSIGHSQSVRPDLPATGDRTVSIEAQSGGSTMSLNDSNKIEDVEVPALGTSRWVNSLGVGDGTLDARFETWKLVLTGMDSGESLIGLGPGSTGLWSLCTERAARGPVGDNRMGAFEKCPVSDRPDGGQLRDPHNWVLYLFVYFGWIGVIVWTATLFSFALRGSRSGGSAWVALSYTGGILLSGFASVLIASPFALIPMSVFLAAAIAQDRQGFHGRAPKSWI